MLCAVSWSDLTLTAGALDVASTTETFWTTVGNLTPPGLLTVFVVAILSGRLVPRSTKDREVSILTQQVSAAELRADASDARADVVAETNRELMAQIRVLLTGMEAVERRAQSPQ